MYTFFNEFRKDNPVPPDQRRKRGRSTSVPNELSENSGSQNSEINAETLHHNYSASSTSNSEVGEGSSSNDSNMTVSETNTCAGDMLSTLASGGTISGNLEQSTSDLIITDPATIDNDCDELDNLCF